MFSLSVVVIIFVWYIVYSVNQYNTVVITQYIVLLLRVESLLLPDHLFISPHLKMQLAFSIIRDGYDSRHQVAVQVHV